MSLLVGAQRNFHVKLIVGCVKSLVSDPGIHLESSTFPFPFPFHSLSLTTLTTTKVLDPSCRSRRIPPPYRSKQENLQTRLHHRPSQRRHHRIRPHLQTNHPNGWIPTLWSNHPRLDHDQGLVSRNQKTMPDFT